MKLDDIVSDIWTGVKKGIVTLACIGTLTGLAYAKPWPKYIEFHSLFYQDNKQECLVVETLRGEPKEERKRSNPEGIPGYLRGEGKYELAVETKSPNEVDSTDSDKSIYKLDEALIGFMIDGKIKIGTPEIWVQTTKNKEYVCIQKGDLNKPGLEFKAEEDERKNGRVTTIEAKVQENTAPEVNFGEISYQELCYKKGEFLKAMQKLSLKEKKKKRKLFKHEVGEKASYMIGLARKLWDPKDPFKVKNSKDLWDKIKTSNKRIFMFYVPRSENVTKDGITGIKFVFPVDSTIGYPMNVNSAIFVDTNKDPTPILDETPDGWYLNEMDTQKAEKQNKCFTGKNAEELYGIYKRHCYDAIEE